ncbi:MAG: LysM peptidoglycan-binding domain-containing protein [Thiomargarita sp.]|nr:LysM peptidoglycan-binding domain-containing protein [Thiomargarita sp.]
MFTKSLLLLLISSIGCYALPIKAQDNNIITQIIDNNPNSLIKKQNGHAFISQVFGQASKSFKYHIFSKFALKLENSDLISLNKQPQSDSLFSIKWATKQPVKLNNFSQLRNIKESEIRKLIKVTHCYSSRFTNKECKINALSIKKERKYGINVDKLRSQIFVKNILANELEIRDSILETEGKNVAKQENLWNRIYAGYQLKHINNTRIQKRVKKHLKFPAYFKEITDNAEPYLYYIVGELEKRGMPLELAFLPAIESRYKPKVKSHRGAAGLWQFMPATGKYLGLKRNKNYDGRYNIVASTNAALDYLQTLYKAFDNDWLLALAAYNYGGGNIRKAMRKVRHRGKGSPYWSLRLPKETRQYIPKILALAKIMRPNNKFGIKLKPIANSPYFVKMQASKQLNLKSIAKLSGLSLKKLKQLNSAYKQNVTISVNGTHHIFVPVKVARILKKRVKHLVLKSDFNHIKNVKPVLITKLNRTTQLQKYKVQKGDTLWKISRRYGINVASIRNWNNLNKNQTLSINQQLILKVATTKKVLNIAKKVINKNNNQKIIHVVKAGDNLWRIAQNYQVSVENLTQWNQLNSKQLLSLGQKLTILREG